MCIASTAAHKVQLKETSDSYELLFIVCFTFKEISNKSFSPYFFLLPTILCQYALLKKGHDTIIMLYEKKEMSKKE